MKFGKQFELYKIPEWFEHYFDYKGIKKVLRFLDNRPAKRNKKEVLQMIKKNYERKYSNYIQKSDLLNRKANDVSNYSVAKIEIPVNINKIKRIKTKRILEAPDLSLLPKEQKLEKFISIYKDKIKYIDDFFNMKLNKYFSKYEKLEKKIQSMDIIDDSFSEEMKSEMDEMEYAVSWKRALSSLYIQTSWLHSYHSINKFAVQKIQKKIIKIFRYNDIEIKESLEKINSQFSFFNGPDRLFDLRIDINKLYAKTFTKDNTTEAKKELEKILQGGEQKHKFHFMFTFIGIFCTCIFFYIILSVIDGNNPNDSFKPFFPFFSFSYIIILCLILIGVDMAILIHYKINYKYIFELNSSTNKIKPSAIFHNAFRLAIIWVFLFIMMKLALKFRLFGEEYTLFPVIMNTILVVMLFFPFHILYLSFRKGLFITLFRNLFPFGKNGVRFKDFVFGDILTSLSAPFKNLFLGYCLLSCRECYLNNNRGPCHKNTIPCIIISVYPQFIRWTQCINKI